MSDKKKFDICVIGGGPGGYVAAIRAAQLGYKVGLVEKAHLGGICLNWGCIPTKALLRTAEVYNLMKNADEFGLSADNIKFDFKKVIERSRGVSTQLVGGIGHLMKKNKIEVIDGYGKLNGKNAVSVRENGDRDSAKVVDIEARHIIFATGARARTLPNLEHDEKVIWSYRKAMTPDEMPKSVLVVGSGAIGIEFASFYNTMGADVTVVEVQDRVMPVEDAEISKIAQKSFESQGMTIKTKAIVQELKKGKNDVTAVVKSEDGKTENIKVDRVILAVGVIGNTENLGLEGTNVKVEKNQIQVDEYLRTDEEGVYAIGDVVSAPWLAHKASHEGVTCVEAIAKADGKFDGHVKPIIRTNIPGCTYCHPQVASVGLTEAAAKEAGYDIKVGKFPFQANGKAIALGETEGMVKTIFDKSTGELIGAHMIGAEVTEMIQGFVLGKSMEAVEEDFIHTIFPHPTLSEMMHESVLDALGDVIHM